MRATIAFNGLKIYYSQNFASDLEKRHPCRVIASPLHRKTIILPSLPTSMTAKRAKDFYGSSSHIVKLYPQLFSKKNTHFITSVHKNWSISFQAQHVVLHSVPYPKKTYNSKTIMGGNGDFQNLE